MENVELVYLYRDGSNFKKHGKVIFSNLELLRIELIERALVSFFLPDGLFSARQIRLPEIFHYLDGPLSHDDHCYHEFDRVRSTTEPQNDPYHRSINEFLAEVAEQSQHGWHVFDPYDSSGSIGWLLTSRFP